MIIDPNWEYDIKLARELCYPQIVISLLQQESNSEARQRILHDARKGVYNSRK